MCATIFFIASFPGAIYFLGSLASGFSIKYFFTASENGIFKSVATFTLHIPKEIAFSIAGVFSYFKANKLRDEAEIENEKIDEIDGWAKENINQDIIDSGLDLNEKYEILYFSRAEKIKNLLMHQFEDVDEGLIDLLTENYYTKLYEDDEAFDEEYEYEEEIEEKSK